MSKKSKKVEVVRKELSKDEFIGPYTIRKFELMNLLSEAVESGDFNKFNKNANEKLQTMSQADQRNLMEYVVRQVLLTLLTKKADMNLLERIFKFSITAAISERCSSTLPVFVLGDMLDGSTLTQCETIFTFLENSANVFKTDVIFKYCQNNLLRLCNDLLRRLSRSQNTVFCGRILLFLAQIFPFSERSGLNIVSEFNLDNTTRISPSDVEILQTKNKYEVLEYDVVTKKPVTDYNLYRKFWCLQDFFRNPPLCYNKLQWRHFTSYTNEVLTIFGSFKSDAIPSSHLANSSDSNPSESKEFAYFAKFLTSPKLLELELGDSKFRRCVLLQFLIIFQYLLSHVKFKLDSYVLTEEQKTWVKDTTTKVYKYLADTPPDGEVFSETVKTILKREEYWNSWKNEGCPNFKVSDEAATSKPKKQKVKLADILDQPGKVILGNDELNRLWNICPDNWEACRAKRRKFVPSLEKFFENAIHQADPANNFPPKEKDVTDPNFCWKGLLLLAKKSPLFFSVNNIPYKTTSGYIEAMIQKIPKESSVIAVTQGSTNDKMSLKVEEKDKNDQKGDDLDTADSEPLAEENYEDGNEEMFPTPEEESSPKEEFEPSEMEMDVHS